MAPVPSAGPETQEDLPERRIPLRVNPRSVVLLLYPLSVAFLRSVSEAVLCVQRELGGLRALLTPPATRKVPPPDWRMSAPPSCLPHSATFDQGTHYAVNEVWQRAHACGFHWSYLVPHHLEEAHLTN